VVFYLQLFKYFSQELSMSFSRIIVTASLIGSSLVASFVAQAQESKEALYTKSLAATCANCHGTNGKVVNGSLVIGLAGLPADYIAAQMKAFKNGTRPATVMHQLAKGYSDAQIDQLAAYFAAQKK
jgi:cytochrome subunit of sulfide dehydrogenase